MKKATIILSVLLLLSGQSWAQRRNTRGRLIWTSAGISTAAGTSLFVNGSAFSDNTVKMNMLNPTYNTSAKIGFTFNENSHLSFEAGYATLGQFFTINQDESLISKNYRFNTTDFTVGYRLISKKILYFEMGGRLSLINRAQINGVDILENVNSPVGSVLIGAGFYPILKRHVEVALGVRMTYGVGAFFKPEYNMFAESQNAQTYNTFTSPVTFTPVIDVAYVFGYFVGKACGGYKFSLNVTQ